MSLPWSSKGTKATPIAADELMIIDSEDANPSTQNKRITIGSFPSAEVFTWTADHSAAGFDLLNVGGITVSNPADTFQYIITPDTITADRILNLPLITSTDTLIAQSLLQTLSNKIFNSTNEFEDDALTIQNPLDTFNYTIQSSAILADRTLTLPLLIGPDTLVTEAHIQTLTNKTIDGDLNTLLDINETQMDVSVGIAGTILTSNGVGLPPTYQVAAGEVFTWTANHDAAGFDLLNVGGIQINNPADTFQYIITPAAILADRILNLPLMTGTDILVLNDFAATLTNKTLDGATNILTGTFGITGLSGTVNFLTDDTTAIIELEANHAIPATQTIAQLDFYDDNSIGTRTKYAAIESAIADATSTSEDGTLKIKVETAGVFDNYMLFNDSSGADITALKNIDMLNTAVIFPTNVSPVPNESTTKFIARRFDVLWLNSDNQIDFAFQGTSKATVEDDRLDLHNTTDILGALNIQFGNSGTVPSSFLRYIQYATADFWINAAAGDTTHIQLDAGASGDYSFNATRANFLIPNATSILELEANHTTPADGQTIAQIDFIDDNSVGTRETFAQIHAEMEDPLSTNKDASLFLSVFEANTFKDYVILNLASDGLIRFQAPTDFGSDALTSVGTVNTHTIPGGTDTFALLNAAQTLDLKTLTNVGPVTMVNRFQYDKGADVASPAGGIMTLGTDGNVFDITGVNTINEILPTSWQAGSVIHLQFDGILTVTNNSGGTNDILLGDGSNMTTAVGDILTLVYNGIDWQEISRSTVGGGGEVFTWTADHDAAGFDLLNAGGITINNPADTFQYIVTPAAIAADRILNLPLLTGTDTLVTEAHIQTLTNKTIDGDDNTIIDINETQQNVSVGTAGTILTSNGVGSPPTYQANDGAQTPWTGNVDAATFSLLNLGGLELNNPADTFQYIITPAAIVADRILNLPLMTGTDTLVLESFAATLTNKTLGTGTIFSVIPTINDGIKFTFNPNATVSGINVGAHTADPSAPVNGDIWYESTLNTLSARINGATVDLGAGGGGEFNGPYTADTDLARFDFDDMGVIYFHTAGPIVNPSVGTTPYIWYDGTPNFALELNTPTSNKIILAINGVPGLTLAAASVLLNHNLDMADKLLLGVNQIREFGTVASAGFLRLANTSTLSWDLVGTGNGSISFNASDEFLISINTGNDYTFSETEFNMQANTLTQAGALGLTAGGATLGNTINNIFGTTSGMTFNTPTTDSFFMTINGAQEYEFSPTEFIIAEANNIVLGTTTGTKIGTATSQKLAFYGDTPVVQPTALTTAETTLTFVDENTPDFALSSLTTTTPAGFATLDEAQALVEVVANNQARIGELETKLQALGLLA